VTAPATVTPAAMPACDPPPPPASQPEPPAGVGCCDADGSPVSALALAGPIALSWLRRRRRRR
jgi:uncharacterized protein (TIGR03382 family)